MPAQYKFFLPIFFFLFFIFAPEVSAQVVINEFSSTDSSDWIEIYNTSSTDVANLSGWIIKDTAVSSVHEFSGELISANGSCFISVSNRLNNAGDKIQLFKDSTQKDCVAYGDGNSSFCNGAADVSAPSLGETVSRVSDGTGSWVVGSSTKSDIECSTLVPTPTSSPTPTPSPSPSPTPTKTPTATPKPTVKAVVTKKPTVILTKTTSDEEESEVLGLREGLEAPSPTPIPESEEKGKIPITALLFVLGGLGFMGVAGYPFLKSMKKRYNIENEEKETAEGDFKPGDS